MYSNNHTYPTINSIEHDPDTDARQAWGKETSIADVAADIAREERARTAAIQEAAHRVQLHQERKGK